MGRARDAPLTFVVADDEGVALAVCFALLDAFGPAVELRAALRGDDAIAAVRPTHRTC